MEREFRVYNYLNRFKIGIESKMDRLSRIEKHIQEIPEDSSDYKGRIIVHQVGDVPIKLDKNFPYLSKRENGNNTDYFRYSTLIRSIIKKSNSEYELFEHTQDDEGVLDMFRMIYCESDVAKQNALMHGVILKFDKEGILITGPARSGKTSLALSLMRDKKATLINEGISLINFEGGNLVGHYIPRQVYLRFSSINQNPELNYLLTNYDLHESPQFIDHDAIRKIIRAKAFHVDAGITVSRKRISKIYGIDTSSSTKISKIIFTGYSEKLKIKNLDKKEALDRLRGREFPLTNTFNRIIAQKDIGNPVKSQIGGTWLENIDFKEISYDARRHLNQETLGELL